MTSQLMGICSFSNCWWPRILYLCTSGTYCY